MATFPCDSSNLSFFASSVAAFSEVSGFRFVSRSILGEFVKSILSSSGFGAVLNAPLSDVLHFDSASKRLHV